MSRLLLLLAIGATLLTATPLVVYLHTTMHEGDGSYPTRDSILDAMVADYDTATVKPSFLLELGDLATNGAKSELRDAKSDLDSLISLMDWYPLTGNHGQGDSLQNYVDSILSPFSAATSCTLYIFRTGNTAWHGISYTGFYNSIGHDTVRARLGAALYQDSVLGIKHRFVFSHGTPYTSVDIADYKDNTDLVALCQQYHVAAYFSGHVHMYEHAAVNGVTYLTVPQSHEVSPDRAMEYPQPSWSLKRDSTAAGWVKCVVSENTISVKWLRPDNVVHDSFTIFNAPDSAKVGKMGWFCGN
jgi:hypothetical protein